MDWQKIPSLSALRAFEAAARTGGLTTAAKELNVTHSAIAQHIRHLESHFGQSLMQREGKTVRATPAGAQLAQGLSDAFSVIGVTVQDVLDQSQKRPLRISTTPNFAANWLMQRIADFWTKHPEIELEILPSNALVDLREENVDVAIRYGAGAWPGVSAERLIAAGFAVVAAPELIGDRNITCLSDLQNDHWMLDEGSSEEKMWLSNNGFSLGKAKITRFATAQLTREAVRAGHGITVSPKPLIENDLENGKLVLLFEDENAQSCYYIVTRTNIISPARNAFIRWIRNSASSA